MSKRLTNEEFDNAIKYLNDLEVAVEKVNREHNKEENYSLMCHFHKEGDISYQFVKNLRSAYKNVDLPRYRLNIYKEERIASITSDNADELKKNLVEWLTENPELLEDSDEEIL